jgi:hypothetical protein
MRITSIDRRATKVAKLAVKREAVASTVEGAAVSSAVPVEVRVSSRDRVSVEAVESSGVSVSEDSVAAAPDSVSVSVASALPERVAVIVVSVTSPEPSVLFLRIPLRQLPTLSRFR